MTNVAVGSESLIGCCHMQAAAVHAYWGACLLPFQRLCVTSTGEPGHGGMVYAGVE